MSDPTFSLAIALTGSDDVLTIDGNLSDVVWGAMPGWQLPGKVARIQYAESDVLHGSVPTSWTWQQGVMSGDVSPTVEDAMSLAAAVADLEAAIGRLTYSVTTRWNGVPTTWRCDPGSLTPSPIDYVELRDNQPVFTLSIPCYPISTPGGD